MYVYMCYHLDTGPIAKEAHLANCGAHAQGRVQSRADRETSRTGLSGRADTRAGRARHVVGGVLDGTLGAEGGGGIKRFEEKRHGEERGAGSQAQEYIYCDSRGLAGRPSD